MKNARNSRSPRLELLGKDPTLASVMFGSPMSSPLVFESSTMTPPSMYGWTLHTNTYKPGVFRVTS